MKKSIILFALLIFAAVLTACTQDKKEENTDEDALKWVEVDVSISPEKPQPNEPVTFKAKVTYGDEVVTDADEVTFEIWRAKDDKHEKIEVKKATKGVYQIEKTFDVEGTYYVIAHVTAEGMHNMPKKEFVVGTPSEPEDENAKSQYMENHDATETENKK
jgi:hypothetical protein